MKKLIVLFIIIFSLTSCFKEKEISTKNLLNSYNKEIYKIDLSNNSLKEIPILKEYLTGVILEETRIIDLSGNKIEDLDNLAFDGFTNLEEINLSGNKINWINLKKLNVKNINLSNNNIEKLSISGVGLLQIDLSNNNLKFGSDISLAPSLTRINLSNNNLINLDGFERFKILENLNLQGNNLEDKHFTILKDYKKLKNLNVSENNISEKALERINKFNLENSK